MNQNLINIEQAAKLLKMGESTLRRKVRDKEIPHVRIGRRVLFDPEDLQKWVNSLKIEPRSE